MLMNMSKNLGRHGFSLPELLLAVCTLAVILMLVVALGLSVVGRNRKAVDVPVGAVAGEGLLTELIYGVTADTPSNVKAWFAAVPSTRTAWKSGTSTMGRINFAYTTDYQSLNGGGSGGANHLVLLEMRVTWQDGTAGAPPGLQQACLMRMIHEP